MPPPPAVLAEAEQGRAEGAALLPHAHDAQAELVERAGVAAHRRRQRRAGRHAAAHVQENRSQPPGVAGGGDAQGLGQRHADGQEGRQLPQQVRHPAGVDPPAEGQPGGEGRAGGPPTAAFASTMLASRPQRPL